MGAGTRQTSRPVAKGPGGARRATGARSSRSRATARRTAGGVPAESQRAIGRFFGVLALLFAALLVVSLVRALGEPGGHANGVVLAFGASSAPVAVVLLAIAVALIARPRWIASAPLARPIAGALVLAFTSLLALGVGSMGGTVGNSVWQVLHSSLGAVAYLAVPLLVVASLVLFGVEPGAIRRAVWSVLVFAAGALWAAFLWTVGFGVWAVRTLWTRPEHPSESLPREPRRESRPRPKPLPEPAEPQVEEPSQITPVVRTMVEERVEPPSREDWALPPITLLESSGQVEVNEGDALRQAEIIEETLKSFGVSARVREINPGPTVTQFALEPGPGTKVNRITSLQNDLALALAAPSIRMEAPVPGQSRVGLEIPSAKPMMVRLRDVMDSGVFHKYQGKLKMALGRDVTGRAVVGDLARMPHLLIAGATGAGKSSCLNSTIVGFLFQNTPEELRFLMVDPKMVELKTFDGVPHLIWPVVTDVTKVVGILKYAIGEMERRYKEFSKLGMRNLDAYNRKAESAGWEKLPRILLIIDELADLMMVAPDEVESSICRLAQMARAVGIHLIIATQRPSVDVVTGLIKANFPSRIAFAVSSQTDSRVILDMSGAERLLGRGDMLFLGPDSAKPVRVQGTWVSDEEIDAVVEYWKQKRPASYDEEVGRILDQEASRSDDPEGDPLYVQAVELAQSHSRLSTSLLQRKLRIGYNRASRLMDALRESGELDTELDD